MTYRFSEAQAVRFGFRVVRSCVSISLLLLAAHAGMAQMPGQNLPGLPSISAEQSEHGIRATMGSEVLNIVVCSDSVIHIVAKANAEAKLGKNPGCSTQVNRAPALPFNLRKLRRPTL